MRSYLITFIVLLALGMAAVWCWGVDNRLSYLSRDYAIWRAKERFFQPYTISGLVVFGDSAVMDGVQPERLGKDVINLGMSGSTPIESYFMLKAILKSPIKPKAVVLSYNAYHFVHPDFYWENTIKFGMISGPDADEVMGHILEFKDKELITNAGFFDFEQRLYSFLLSRGFPAYYISSLFADHYGVREKENLKAVDVVTGTRGQYYFPLANGSKSLNKDTELKTFTVSPVIDLYFRKTVELLKKEGIPGYFYVMPINEVSVPHIAPQVLQGYEDYLGTFTQNNPDFHLLGGYQTVYPWTLFSDYAHLNEKGTLRFNKEFAHLLDRAGVPGGPYGDKKS